MFKYKSLEAWKRSHAALITTLRATDAPNHPRTRPVFDQLRRAIVSVEANIVEGYALDTPRLYQRHLRIALGSAAEAECMLRVAGELEYLPSKQMDEIEGLIGGAMKALIGLLRRPQIIGTRNGIGGSHIPTPPRL